jgi:hypothetical protein
MEILKELLELGVHTVTIRPSKIDGEYGGVLEADQSVRLQRFSHKIYGGDILKSLETLKIRAKNFKGCL